MKEGKRGSNRATTKVFPSLPVLIGEGTELHLLLFLCFERPMVTSDRVVIVPGEGWWSSLECPASWER